MDERGNPVLITSPARTNSRECSVRYQKGQLASSRFKSKARIEDDRRV